jgi:cation transport regulator ChaC
MPRATAPSYHRIRTILLARMSFDTTALNRQRHRFEGRTQVWLFGYGSLIWKADFAFIERRTARLHGWSRRFWQGSHDHRGTRESPGRVLTLVADPAATCVGIAYLVTPAVFDALDQREKNGYLRHVVPLAFEDDSVADGLVYLADEHNAAWLGPASDAAIARQVAQASGPSGANRDYVLHLAEALHALDADDAHVFAIERALRDGTATPAQRRPRE